MSRTQRVIAGVTLLVGVYLIVIPFALSLFSRTRDAERLSDYYRPLMSKQGIAGFRQSLEILNAGGTELYDSFLPTVRAQLGMSEDELNAFIRHQYPQVAAFLVRAPEVVKYLNPAVQAVLAQGDNFHDADQFPVANVDLRLGPWALIAIGVACVGLGFLVLTRARTLALLTITVGGLALVAGPLALQWIHQTDAAEKVAEAARAPFSAQVANTTVTDTYHFDAAFTEMGESLFPDLAEELGKSPPEMDSYLHTEFPALMRFLDRWDAEIYEGSRELSLSQIEFMDEFHNADATPYRALPWLFIVPGAVLLVVGAYGLARSLRKREGRSRTD